jgi:uncharacterized protein YdeI (YjbR/CyaY-like superfamily)
LVHTGAAVPSSSQHPPTWKFGYAVYHAESRAQWRAWLEVNHGSAPGVWLCSWRTKTGRPICAYPEAVEEALCFGWIDSTVNVLDDERGLADARPPHGSDGQRRPSTRRSWATPVT